MKNNEIYNFKLKNEKIEEFMEKYPKFDESECIRIAEKGELREFRLLCNFLAGSRSISIHGGESLWKTYSNEDSDTLRFLEQKCNERVSRILGDKICSLYKFFMESQQHARWSGDERYKLFGYDLPPHSDRQVILSVAIVANYLNVPLSVDTFMTISRLYKSAPYWDLYPELDMYDPKVPFSKRNEDRKENVRRWSLFMEFVWKGRWDQAYNLIFEYNLIKEEMLEKRKR